MDREIRMDRRKGDKDGKRREGSRWWRWRWGIEV
jgi:hypothetical protein